MPIDFDEHGRYRPQPREAAPFQPGDLVVCCDRAKPFRVACCERRVAHGVVRWVVENLDGERFYADDCRVVGQSNP